MKQFPFVHQSDSMDCGAACLKMAARYYGKDYSLEYLRELAGASRQGVTMLGISKAAEAIGMRTIGGKVTYESLVTRVPLPCILHWNQNHFVVFTSIRKKRGNDIITIADPACGLVSYSKKEFCDHWVELPRSNKGIVLLIEPTQEFFNKEKDNPTSTQKFHFLNDYFKGFKKQFAYLFLLLFFSSVVQLAFPYLTQTLVDKGIGGSDISVVWMVLVAELALLAGSTVADFTRRHISLRISTKINISLVSDYLAKLTRLPMRFFDTKLLGDILQRIDDHGRVERFITSQCLMVLFSMCSCIVFSVVLITYNVKIFLIFLIGSLLYALWVLLFLQKRKVLDYKFFEQQAKNKNILYQIINGMQEIKLQGCEQRKRSEWEKTQLELYELNNQSLHLQQNQTTGSFAINELKNIIVTVLTATSVIAGKMTLGMMLATQYIIGQLNQPIEQIVGFIYQWQDVNISMDRMNEIRFMKEEKEEGQTEKPPTEGAIVIQDLQFKYDKYRNENTLNIDHVTIPPQAITAIVGPSGGGKTTLLKLLLGYYPPLKGSIKIAGIDLEHIDIDQWRSQCGVVMQDGFIFSESIARNIAVDDGEIDTIRLHEAATIACIDEDIQKMPLKYDTVIGSEGRGISQGQKQRILIARAIYKNPMWVFFDEATNSIDANTEKAIVENLKGFYKGKTVVVVAHRLSTVINADLILVMNNGKIEEMGNHKTLLNHRGIYYSLVKNQLNEDIT